jgi:hypothetical protein
MEASTLSRKERRQLEQGASETSPVPVSEPVEAIASTDAPATTEALKTDPVGSLPVTTGKLPVSLPAVSKPKDSEAGSASNESTVSPEVSVPPRKKSVPWDEDDEVSEAIPESPWKVRSVEEIMEQDGITDYNEALLIAEEEEADARLASMEADRIANLEREAVREQERLAKAAKDKQDSEDKAAWIEKRAAAKVHLKQAKNRAFVFLALTLACLAGFFLMGGF